MSFGFICVQNECEPENNNSNLNNTKHKNANELKSSYGGIHLNPTYESISSQTHTDFQLAAK